MTFKSKIVTCDEANKNDHIYTKECIERALSDSFTKERLETNSFFGYILEDITEDLQTGGFGDIPVGKISHVLKKYWWEDNTLWGEFESLDTPKGKLLQEFVLNDDCMALSGYGDLEEDGTISDYTLCSINFTANKA